MKSQEIPPSAAQAMQEARPWAEIEEMAVRPVQETFALEGAEPGLPSHPIYYLSLLELTTSRSFERALLTGWRRVTHERGAAWSVAVEHAPDRSFRFASRYPVGALERRLSRLDSLRALVPEVDECELRAIGIPPLMELAVWLQFESDKRNLVIPIHTCSRSLAAGRAYTDAQVIDALMEPARSLLGFSPGLPPAR
ncbi:MAG TPA: hypothetical protein VKF41_00740 [Bryobacteraceae bacterium]|nr:hypothetical protein [Bryobacteraceae bacterium]